MAVRTQPVNAVSSIFGQPITGEKQASITVTSNSHACEVDADYAVWDTTSNVFVDPNNTNFNSNK
jgi:hypothetical protein